MIRKAIGGSRTLCCERLSTSNRAIPSTRVPLTDTQQTYVQFTKSIVDSSAKTAGRAEGVRNASAARSFRRRPRLQNPRQSDRLTCAVYHVRCTLDPARRAARTPRYLSSLTQPRRGFLGFVLRCSAVSAISRFNDVIKRGSHFVDVQLPMIDLSNHFLKDATRGRCFLCGERFPFDQIMREHAFPRWLQRKFDIWNRQLTLVNGTTIN